MKKITHRKTSMAETMTIITEDNIRAEILKFNTSWWMVDYYIDGQFDSGLREKFHTKKECVDHFDIVKKIIAKWESE